MDNPIIESISDGLFCVDAAHLCTYINAAALGMLGYSHGQCIGKNMLNLIFDEAKDRSQFLSSGYAICNTLLSHKIHTVEDSVFWTAGGKALSVRYTSSPHIDGGKMIGAVVLFSDISGRKNTEEKIKEINQRYEYVTKATFDAIWDWDIPNDNIYWGEGFELIFGYHTHGRKSDINSWARYIHPEDFERVIKRIYEVIDGTQNNWTDEYRFLKKDDAYAYVSDKGFVIRDDGGKAVRMVGAMQDITKRKKEEHRLKLLESVITNTNDAVLITESAPLDAPGPGIIYVNEAFSKMTGYTAGEVTGISPRILQGPKSDPKELKRLSKALRAYQPCEITLINYKKMGKNFG